ncbi:unnamed protein product [Prorocentrum cordatum]|uniref:Uncharacterized protein n=1 Tax=Prorocentrum cordatum TaxID=2364126 RepID=A0ABN9RDW7_9DINO|nr:unnamed protein product [Polarella glacialis]
MCLYLDEFQMQGGGLIDFAGLTDLQQYEAAMKHLNPERASQWWSWFRISSVTYSMLRRHQGNEPACARIWNAHLSWSSRYPYFDEAENVEMVMRCERSEAQGKKMSFLPTLIKMVRFDNPGMQVRETAWRWTLASGGAPAAPRPEAPGGAGRPMADGCAAPAGPSGAAAAA